METEIKVFRSSNTADFINAVKKARKHRLFVNGWYLGDKLRDIIYYYSKGLVTSHTKTMIPQYILIAEKDNTPVACSVVLKNNIQIFVRKKYRRQGIGSLIFDKAMKITKRKKPFFMCVEDARQIAFYSKNKKKFE